MKKLVLITNFGEMLVSDKDNDVEKISEIWQQYAANKVVQIIRFTPEHPVPAIPGVLGSIFNLKVDDIRYVIELEVASIDLPEKPGITIVGSMADIKS